jgi:GT2 family glycosyltransferase
MQSSYPLVSIITPTYNHESYISECIKSVIRQSYSNWEMIVVDDGSKDNTRSIIETFIKDDKRIKLIHQDNLGIMKLSESYNKALSMAQGKYIAILEGDDYWEKDKLKVQVDVMETHDDVIFSFGKACARIGFSQDIIKIHPEHFVKNNRFYFNEPPGAIFNVVFDDFLPPLTYMIRKDALLKINGFIQIQPFPAVDLSTFLELSKHGKFYFINEVLGTWRQHPSQTTKMSSIDIVLGSEKIVRQHYRDLSMGQKAALAFNEKLIDKSLKKRMVIAYARMGRFKLIQKDFKGARQDYVKAIYLNGFTNPVWKLRALTGFVLSLFNRDVERIASLLGRKSFK